MGKSDGLSGDILESYCTYQQRIRTELLRFAKEKSWFVIRQTDESTEEIAKKICDRLNGVYSKANANDHELREARNSSYDT